MKIPPVDTINPVMPKTTINPTPSAVETRRELIIWLAFEFFFFSLFSKNRDKYPGNITNPHGLTAATIPETKEKLNGNSKVDLIRKLELKLDAFKTLDTIKDPTP